MSNLHEQTSKNRSCTFHTIRSLPRSHSTGKVFQSPGGLRRGVDSDKGRAAALTRFEPLRQRDMNGAVMYPESPRSSCFANFSKEITCEVMV